MIQIRAFSSQNRTHSLTGKLWYNIVVEAVYLVDLLGHGNV